MIQPCSNAAEHGRITVEHSTDQGREKGPHVGQLMCSDPHSTLFRPCSNAAEHGRIRVGPESEQGREKGPYVGQLICSDPDPTLIRPCSNLTGSDQVGVHIRSDQGRIRVGTGQSGTLLYNRNPLRPPISISRILDFSRRLTIVIPAGFLRGLACAAHTDVVYIHICGHVSAGSRHEIRIFPRRNNRCCSGANGRLPSRHWHPSQQ